MHLVDPPALHPSARRRSRPNRARRRTPHPRLPPPPNPLRHRPRLPRRTAHTRQQRREDHRHQLGVRRRHRPSQRPPAHRPLLRGHRHRRHRPCRSGPIPPRPHPPPHLPPRRRHRRRPRPCQPQNPQLRQRRHRHHQNLRRPHHQNLRRPHHQNRRLDHGPPPHITALIPTTSLMGRYADPADLLAHPELGGRTLPNLAAHVTAANKLSALHEPALQGNHERIQARGRDLYDLACVARSPAHAAAAREHIPAIAAHNLQTSRTRRGQAGRPENGYSSSPALTPGPKPAKHSKPDTPRCSP